jgi:pyruvate/2-oxoglutarate dehydrogenase complex dihydrolipoamide dehydrogenase (E3) component
MKKFDAIIIGAGQAGPSLAGRLTGAGMKIAFIERHLFGGTCVNTGCSPTKALVASAHVAHLIARSQEYGVILDGASRVNMQNVKARMDQIVFQKRTASEQYLAGMNGCTVIRGQARFVGPKVIHVNGEELTAPKIFLDVGGRAVIPDFPGIQEVPYLTNSSFLKLDQVPEHLIVVGGSYVGLEFAQIYRRFGAQVTVIEKSGRLVSREDEDVSNGILEILRGEGIDVHLDSECIHLKPHEKGVEVGVSCKTGEPYAIGTHLLLAVGRRPNTDDLGLDAAGVHVDEKGYIQVDDTLETNVKGIWALGDCNGRGAFTHTAYNDYEIVAANLLDGEHRKVTDRILGYALYIDPPLGRAGMTEHEARASGKPLLIGKRPMTRVARAIEKGETQGFMKIIVDATTRKILGASILGVGGDEAIHGILDIMQAGVPYDVLQHTMGIHPTVSELIPTVLGDLHALTHNSIILGL